MCYIVVRVKGGDDMILIKYIYIRSGHVLLRGLLPVISRKGPYRARENLRFLGQWKERIMLSCLPFH